MYDYAHVHLLGRVVDNAQFFNLDTGDRTPKAIFTVACNISFKRKDDIDIRTIYRKILVLNSLAKYVKDCQEGDSQGLKGRLITLAGMMDNELSDKAEDIILINYNDGGFLKIMDRRRSND